MESLNMKLSSIKKASLENDQTLEEELMVLEDEMESTLKKVRELYDLKINQTQEKYKIEQQYFEEKEQFYKKMERSLLSARSDITFNLDNIENDNVFTKEEFRAVMDEYWKNYRNINNKVNPNT